MTVSHETTVDDPQRIIRIPLELLDVGPNVRTTIDEAALAELTESVRTHGVLQPIKARRNGDRWLVTWGQRRTLSARAAGLTWIPAIEDLDGRTGAERSIEQLVENFVRADLHALDEARALREIVDAAPDRSLEDLAKEIGRSRPWVSNTLRLLEAPAVVQTALADGVLSATQARSLAATNDEDAAWLVGEVATRGLSAAGLDVAIKQRARWRAHHEKQAEENAVKLAAAVAKVAGHKLRKAQPKAVLLVEAWDQGAFARALRDAGSDVRSVAYNEAMELTGDESCTCDALFVRADYNGVKVGRGCGVTSHMKRIQKARQRAIEKKQAAEKKKRLNARQEARVWGAGLKRGLAEVLSRTSTVVLEVLRVHRATGYSGNLVPPQPPRTRDELVDDTADWLVKRLAGLESDWSVGGQQLEAVRLVEGAGYDCRPTDEDLVAVERDDTDTDTDSDGAEE